ncbi:fibrous sheath-interacting protein 2-like [Octodon degus]|uniref:Fibrous sheath-interacting protein 2-like n=1 Tax=Octodon degus TaxID=10160 RepID=A0A6P6EMA1_OCTDE|nr:fibrous sheath-interacting protein 2-like [Octodon degus]
MLFSSPAVGHNLCSAIGFRLYQPSLQLNFTDPYCQLMETNCKCLLDPHLKSHSQRNDMPRTLRSVGFMTSNNKTIDLSISLSSKSSKT